MTLPSFEPVFPIPLIVVLAAVAAVLTGARAMFGQPLKPGWLQGPVLLLRFSAIAFVTLFLLNPSDPINVATPESRSLVLLDESSSMSLGAPTRWAEASQWTTDFREAMVTAGLERPDVAVFAAGVERVNDFAARQPAGTATRLSDALSRVITAAGANPPDHIVVVSDGRAQDRQALPEALALARSRGTGISTLAVGRDTPPRNASVAAVQAPRVVRAHAPVVVEVQLATSGYPPGEPLALTLRDESGNRVSGAEMRVPSPGAGPVTCALNFESGIRTAKYTLELAQNDGDTLPEDNRFAFTVEVATSKLRVLFVEGTHVKRSVGPNGHAWNDMELMTRAWDASGEIEYQCLTPVSEYLNRPNLVGVSFANGEMIPDKTRDFPKTREELYRYDVMLISDVPVGNFSTEQMQWVVDWVTERGGGFLMGGGYTTFDVGHYDQTPWERITPVDMLGFGDGFNEQRFKVQIPKSARKHPTWRISPDLELNEQILDSHPDFTGMNRVRRAKPGAMVLMTRPSFNGEPVIAAQQYGRGRSIAYLGDPNGGWAKFLVGWGPPGGPAQGGHTELGHGDRFKVNTTATKAATGAQPPHPSPYYAQYWTNVVKWLGENSIRWRRDKLAGRVTATQAQPGSLLPVAAEVLAVTNRDALLALNVGARLDRPGSPRVRLEYDRDRREFTGQLPIPADFAGGEAAIVFDTVAAGDSLTDAARVGVRHTNPEWAETAPDREFLAELAKVSGGRVIENVADAVAVCREAAAARARDAQRRWSQPSWTRWPWWTALAGLLCGEFALRRRAATNAALIASIFLVLVVPTQAQEATPSPSEIQALLEQLGAPRVRLRDEAEDKLKSIRSAFEAAKLAMKESPNAEIRLRARNVVQALRQNLWQQESESTGHASQPSTFVRRIAVSPDGKSFFTRGEDHVRVWEAESGLPGITFGIPATRWKDWQRGGLLQTLALSPDGTRLLSTDSLGNLVVNQVSDGKELKRWQNVDPSNPSVPPAEYAVWNAAFFPDGRRIAITDRAGFLRIWNLETGALERSESIWRPQIGRALAISPDGNFIACSTDWAWDPDHLCVWDVAQAKWSHRQVTERKTMTLTFSRDGKQLLGASHTGFVHLWPVSPTGALGPARRIGRVGKEAWGAAFSTDEKSIFAVTNAGEGQLSQWDVETGEELWRSPQMAVGLVGVSVLGPNRVVTIGLDEKVRIWQRR